MKNYIAKKKSESKLAKEPVVAYRIKKEKTVKKRPIGQLLITPKNRRSLIALKKLLNQTEGVEDMEVIVDGEVVDDDLLKKMIASKKSGLVSEGVVMATLNRIIKGK